MKRAEKRISRVIVQQRKSTFFGEEVWHKCAKKQCREEKKKRVNYVNLMPITFIKGSCYETPLYGHVCWTTNETVIRDEV